MKSPEGIRSFKMAKFLTVVFRFLFISTVFLPRTTLAIDDEKSQRSLLCLKNLIAISNGWQPAEKHGGPERWGFDGQDGAGYYDMDFGALYQKTGNAKSLNEILSQRQKNHQSTNVLDLFGSGFFVEDQSMVSSITGMRFGPFSREVKEEYRTHTKSLIAKLPPTPIEILGDAMNPKTWDQLHVSMKQRNIHKMDLIAMRPMGGWELGEFAKTQDQNALALSFIVENVLQIISHDGQFFFSLDTPFLPGNISKNSAIRRLVNHIERETEFHLHLEAIINKRVNKTVGLRGVLYPK